MAALYANCFRIGHNANEFVLEGCQAYEDGENTITVSRLVITPQTALKLHQLLGESLERHERMQRRLNDQEL